MQSHSHPKRSAGFTLIELMICVALVAVISAVAIPTYKGHVVKVRRTDVQQQMMDLAQDLERYFTINGRYVTAAGGTTCGVSAPTTNSYYSFGVAGTTSVTIPSANTASPGPTNCRDNTFVIIAQPVASKSQASDGWLAVDQSGARQGSVKGGNWIY